MASILVVEDNADLAYGLRNNLEIEGHTVHVAEDGLQGLEAARSLEPDLLILDLMLPEMNGFRLLRALRAEGRRTPVLILTARGEETDKVLGLKIGADDYVTKPFGVLELMARVEAVLRRCEPEETGPVESSTPVLRFGAVEVDPAARIVRRDGTEVPLTPKEFALLLALAGREGAAVSRIALMREVWGHRAAIASRTVDTHIAELRRKLEVEPSRPRHILTVHKVGYRFRA